MHYIKFTRALNDIRVEYQSTLIDPNNLDENFIISAPKGSVSYITNQLFYFFDRKKWTLNEMIFFANNNQFCVTIANSNKLDILQYAACANCNQGFKINTQCFIINNQFININ